MADIPKQYFRQIMPEMPLKDVPAGVRYYVDVLGFEINYQNPNFAVMDRDKARILLAKRPNDAGTGACYIYIRDAEVLFAEYSATVADIQGPLVRQPWGLHEFIVHDCEGNRITFGRPFEPGDE